MMSIGEEKKSLLFLLELRYLVSQSLRVVDDASEVLDLSTWIILFHKSLNSHGIGCLCV